MNEQWKDRNKRWKHSVLKSFTLIELLIVIAIIAIVAGMLLPSLNRARLMAKKTQCTSNKRNIGLLLANYSNDFSNYFIPNQMKTPPKYASTWTKGVYYGVNVSWQQIAYLYCMSERFKNQASFNKVFSCPLLSDKEKKTIANENYTIRSYGYASLISGTLLNTNTMRKIHRITKPEKRIIIGEQSAAMAKDTGQLTYAAYMDKARHKKRLHALAVPLFVVESGFPNKATLDFMIGRTE